MSPRTPLLLSLLLALGCSQLQALAGKDENKDQKAKPSAATSASKAEAEPTQRADRAQADPGVEQKPPAKHRGKSADPDAPAKIEPPSPRFALPFAHETSPTEPLARARGFLAEVLDSNRAHSAQGRPHFAPFVDGEAPRATVLTCADSRVQASAWDLTPENDDFTVRNLGNQVPHALGSLEYGVLKLHTPLLLIVGHTGCTALAAALAKPAELSEPILNELAPLKLPPARKGASADAALTDAVIANINAQVAAATQHFSALVHAGELTVVGAVYDLRNDLGKGFGKLQILNVNTNTDPARIDSFLKAVQAPPGGAARKPGEASVEDRVKKILDRAQRAFPAPRRPTVTVSSVELSAAHEPGGSLHQPR